MRQVDSNQVIPETKINLTKPPRDNALDAMRAFLMLLGIPYHAALFYSIHDAWVMAGPSRSIWMDAIVSFVHSFRMGAFFLLAGYFAALTLSKKPPVQWLPPRLKQLGIPLISATLIVMPFVFLVYQYGYVALGEKTWDSAFPDFLSRLVTPGRHWVGHLWFLTVLIYYSLLTALCWSTINKIKIQKIINFADSRAITFFSAILIFFMTYKIFYTSILFPFEKVVGKEVLSSLSLNAFVSNLPNYLLGIFMYKCPSIFAKFRKFNVFVALAAIGMTVLYFVASQYDTTLGRIATRASSGACELLMTSFIMAISTLLIKNKNRAIDFFVSSALVVYIFHFPIVLYFGVLLNKLSMNIGLEFFIMTASSYFLSFGIYLIVMKSRFLFYLFNGKASPSISRELKTT